MRRLIVVLAVLVTLPTWLAAKPGVRRWQIKTSLLAGAPMRNSTLAALIGLTVPNVKESEFDANRIPGTGSALHEGDLVTIVGWLHLVAYESSATGDEDYHMQLTSSPTDGDQCVIVEAPEPSYVKDSSLASQSAAVRAFVDGKLLNGKHPGGQGNVMNHPVFVSITGQLFADLTHSSAADPGGGRGKRGMHAATVWELHPITDIHFAPKPK